MASDPKSGCCGTQDWGRDVAPEFQTVVKDLVVDRLEGATLCLAAARHLSCLSHLPAASTSVFPWSEHGIDAIFTGEQLKEETF